MFNQYAVDVDPDQGYQFREHPNRAGEGNGGDKTFEVAAFLERMRAMLVCEEGDRLWLARATPRTWLEQGKKISVSQAPTWFGTVAYRIVSDVDHDKIDARFDLPSRSPPAVVLLRLRTPQARPLKRVAVNGQPWSDFDPTQEYIRASRQ